MPLVDEVLAAGRTPLQLKEKITASLSKFVEGPEVTVIVISQDSSAYYVLGEVEQNGEFPLEKEVTLLQALARANGFTDWADQKNLLLLRKDKNGEEKRIRINYRDIVSGKTPEHNLHLQPGDTLVVPY
jgi:polysaccharide export outer membrane protein